MFIEAEEARLSQCVEDARAGVLESVRRLARQRYIVEELERGGHQTTEAKRQLAALTAAQQQDEKSYASFLTRRDRMASVD